MKYKFFTRFCSIAIQLFHLWQSDNFSVMFFFFFIAGPVSKLNSLLLTIRIPVTAHSCSQCTRYFIQSLLEIYSLALNLMVLPGARGRSWNLTKILLVYFEVGVGVSTLRQYSVVHAFIPRFQRHQIFHNHFVNLLFHFVLLCLNTTFKSYVGERVSLQWFQFLRL